MENGPPQRWRSTETPLQSQVAQEPQTHSAPESRPREDIRIKTSQTSVTSIANWPAEARPLKEKTWISCLYLVGDIVLVLTPIFFILLGIAAIVLNKQPTMDNAFGSRVEVATQLGPTIFPIVFAAISGRSMKMIARYLAERGAKLGTLELLMASQSVWGTVESQLLMRKLTIVGIHLLFLWALSPLGGQASLRILQTTQVAEYSNTRLRYLTTGPAGTMWGLETTFTDDPEFEDTDALYVAALIAPIDVKLGPQDTWGNVKIPSLDCMDQSHAHASGWITVPSNMSTPEGYTSLVGLPVVGRSIDRDSNFSVEYTYLSTNCSTFEHRHSFPYAEWPSENITEIQKIIPGQIAFNETLTPAQANSSSPLFLQTDLPIYIAGGEDTPDNVLAKARFDAFNGFINASAMNASSSIQRTITVGSVFWKDHTDDPDSYYGINLANCSVSQNHVEVQIGCIKADCAATKMRKSITDSRSNAFTGFDHQLVANSLLLKLPKSTTRIRGTTATERFLSDTSAMPFKQPTGSMVSDDSAIWTDLSSLTAEVFSRRFGLVLNTYYQLSVSPTGYFGSLPNNLSIYGPDTIPARDIDAWLPANLSATNHTFMDWWSTFDGAIAKVEDGMPFIGATTTATEATHHEIYACNFAWVALLFVTSSVILLTGLGSLLLKRKTMGPELFGFVSSMTYENPYVRIPDGGTVLDAMERARLLRDLNVRVGDVLGEEEIGHVAFAAGTSVRLLERGRLYA